MFAKINALVLLSLGCCGVPKWPHFHVTLTDAFQLMLLILARRRVSSGPHKAGLLLSSNFTAPITQAQRVRDFNVYHRRCQLTDTNQNIKECFRVQSEQEFLFICSFSHIKIKMLLQGQGQNKIYLSGFYHFIQG